MNPATQFTVFVAGIIFCLNTLVKFIPALIKLVNGGKGSTGVNCNYPMSGGGCAYSSRDFASMRAVEIVNGVQAVITPELENQSIILGQIRDSVRELNRKDNR